MRRVIIAIRNGICAFIAITCVFDVLALSSQASDQIPGAKQTQPIVITHATVHTVSDTTMSDASVLFVDGVIKAVGAQVVVPKGTKEIDAKGAHVYPSIIDPLSIIGLKEVDSVRATVDSAETGELNPNVRAEVAFQPDSELIPVARANGVLLAGSAPEGGLVSGRSALMMMDGWTWEEMTLKANLGMHIHWPQGSDESGSGSELKTIEDLFEKSRRYGAVLNSNTPPDFDARLDAMQGVLKRDIPVIVHAIRANQIRSAIAFAKKYNLRVIIYGGYDALDCKELLLAHKVPIIVAGVYRIPARRDLPYDDGYSLPSRLHAAGIPFCISTGGRFSGSTLRNLPYHAATASAYGLDPAQALRAITLSTAEILGVADRVGALKPGLDATLFIADGDILETPTQVTHAFVQGRAVQLESRHTQLYKKYSTKYDRMETTK